MLQPRKSSHKIATFDSNAITFTILGIVFVLLIISLVMPPPHHGHGPHLPTVNHPVAMRRADRDDALRLAVTRDGLLYLGSDRTDEIRMIQDFKIRLSRGAEAKLYIEADARARYSSVCKVLDAAAASGIYQIGFLVEQRKDISR
jgi:biopolymer transport protein ExbD